MSAVFHDARDSNLVDAQKINTVKVFSATKAKDRELLGARVSAWIEANPDVEIANTVVTQSSDKAFHCLAITLFAHRDPPASSNL